MANYSHPGVYVEEISSLPPSVLPVETAIPAFIGYTGVPKEPNLKQSDLQLKPKKVFSMQEYEQYFGLAHPESDSISVSLSFDSKNELIPEEVIVTIDESKRSKHLMNYALQAYFLNGGGPCWIVSVGPYTNTIVLGDYQNGLIGGLTQVEYVDEATILVFPEGSRLGDPDRKTLYDSALEQCQKKKNRFLIADVLPTFPDPNKNVIDNFRDNLIGFNHLKYAAAYAPDLITVLNFQTDDTKIDVTINPQGISKIEEAAAKAGKDKTDTLISRLWSILERYLPSIVKALFPDEAKLKEAEKTDPSPIKLINLKNDQLAQYNFIKAKINEIPLILPPSPIMAGIYVQIDQTRGVYKAPANVSLTGVIAPSMKISDAEHDGLNIHASGKSINAIRSYTGRGVLVFGARTLAGNDNEWRYISVRRFFNFAEISIKNTIEQFLFQPNDKNTWERVKAMITNFLTDQWKQGALVGNNPEQAFLINVGLGSTMTPIDILEGRMNVEVGMAVVRPAEFIVLKFSHLMQNS